MPKYDYYKKKVNKLKIVKNIISIYVISVIFVLFFNTLIIQAYKIPSNSMEPNLKEGTRVLVNKFSYGPKYPFTDFRVYDATKSINRGDVIVFYSSEYMNTFILYRMFSSFVYTVTFSAVDLSKIVHHYDNNIYIKRVVGLPKDKIKFSLVNGKVIVLINGIPEKRVIDLNYGLIEETEKSTPLIASILLQTEYVIKDGEYFVLGDNRISSSDSRIWGSISKKQIQGKAILKYWPIKDFGVVK
jgi:signal peptidase I